MLRLILIDSFYNNFEVKCKLTRSYKSFQPLRTKGAIFGGENLYVLNLRKPTMLSKIHGTNK
uniref:CSON005845 protein n=1 Tax=Culicoides sonorensis TaxID=179676 RepID=A0A336KAE7_CULSO